MRYLSHLNEEFLCINKSTFSDNGVLSLWNPVRLDLSKTPWNAQNSIASWNKSNWKHVHFHIFELKEIKLMFYAGVSVMITDFH